MLIHSWLIDEEKKEKKTFSPQFLLIPLQQTFAFLNISLNGVLE